MKIWICSTNYRPVWNATSIKWSRYMPDLSKMHHAEKRLQPGKEYIGVHRIDGPLVFIQKTHPVGYRELVECVDSRGDVRLGMVLDTSEDTVVVQVYGGTSELTLPGTRVRFRGEPLQ